MPQSPEIVIIGGGVIGLTTAFFLAREGARVTVLDKQGLGLESSWAGAGIITPGNPRRARSPLGQLKARSAALFPELSSDLRERTGIDNGYSRCGGLELRRSSDALERQRLQNLLREERGEGLHCEVLDAKQLQELEPALSPSLPGGIRFPDTAQVRNPWHLKALIAACEQLGVELCPGCPVTALERDKDRITGVGCPSGPRRAEHFLVAAGAWSDLILHEFGVQCGIRPIRGQIVLLNAQQQLFRHILQAGSEYLVPRADGHVLIGSTEEDAGFEKQTTAAAVQHLLELGIRLVPGLADAPVERCWAGLRPGNPDGRPFLGPVPGLTNLFIAAGHFRAGIHLSPITGLLMKELILQQPLTMPIEAFRLDRPGISIPSTEY